jgi:hypothetical protein
MGDLLSSGGIGVLGSNLFLSLMPDQPDTCVAVFETGGFPALHTMGVSNPVAENPGIQVICRGANYQTARILAKDVDVLLNGLRNRTINGVTYRWVQGNQAPFFLMRDENNREEIGCNYSIIRDSATSS